MFFDGVTRNLYDFSLESRELIVETVGTLRRGDRLPRVFNPIPELRAGTASDLLPWGVEEWPVWEGELRASRRINNEHGTAHVLEMPEDGVIMLTVSDTGTHYLIF